jgi:hypothetical protein
VVIGSALKEGTPPALEPADGTRDKWRIAQFVLAAGSAVPLLWWGGLHGWPWDSGTPANSVPAADAANPVSLQIDRLAIDAPLDPLNTDSGSAALTPPGYGRAGWYQGGVLPGNVGRAVIEGHSTDASGSNDVFGNLASARIGDSVVIKTAGGASLKFTVRKVASYDVADVPSDEVFGSDGKTAQLRIIAPSGAASGNSFQQDLVVFADAVS